MKKKSIIIILFTVLIPIIFLILESINSYTIQDATNNNDFITSPELINIDLFNKFLNDINNNKDAIIRITVFSKEGKPHINDLEYSDDKIYLHSYYPNKIFNKMHTTGEYTTYVFENRDIHTNFYLLNEDSGFKTYICQFYSKDLN